VRVLLTGAAGFAGSHIADEIVRTTDWHIVALDCLTYAGKLSNLSEVPANRMTFICHDFRSRLTPHLLDYIGRVDYIIHNGAETHVLNSFRDPELFVQSNVVGTLNMLEATRVLKPKTFVYVSTDEVFGQADDTAGSYLESEALNPSNPYSASKAGGEMLVRAYAKSFEVPYLITRTMNMFGKRQHAEKFIPMTMDNIRNGQNIEVHTGRDGEMGSRQWIHASDQAAALIFLLRSEQRNDTFHIAGVRKTNLEVVTALSDAMGLPITAHKVNAYERFPGHDLHYALDDTKIRRLGWKPRLTFEQGLALTV
jgi:dTDP-glucose 4,6-dehydratase